MKLRQIYMAWGNIMSDSNFNLSFTGREGFKQYNDYYRIPSEYKEMNVVTFSQDENGFHFLLDSANEFKI